MTTYRVPVADPLLATVEGWRDAPGGFRFVSADGPWLAHPNITICTFEDDGAPPELEGQLIEPVIMNQLDGPPVIVERHIVGAV